MRYNSLVRRPLPRWDVGCELEPRCPQVHVVRDWSHDCAVKATRHPLKAAPGRSESLESGRPDSFGLDLPPGEQTPLFLG